VLLSVSNHCFYNCCTIHSIIQGAKFDLEDSPLLEDGELLPSDASFDALAHDDPLEPVGLESGEELKGLDELYGLDEVECGGQVLQEELPNNRKEKALTEEVGGGKQKELQESNKGRGSRQREATASGGRPVKLSNINKDPQLYAIEMQSKDTQKSTKYAVNTYNATMLTLHGAAHLDLHLVPISELPTRLAKFFMVVTQKNGKTSLNASSLGTIFQSLARFLSEEYTPRVDIKADHRFKVVRKNLKAAQKASCKDGQVPGKMRAEAFQDKHLAECWDKKTLGRDNPDALAATVHGICIMQLGFRAKQECYNLRNADFIFGKEGKHGIPEKVEVSERITKTRQGELHGVRNLRPVIYADHVNPDVCPVRTLLAFQDRKTESQRAPLVRLFLCVKQSARRNPAQEHFWFTSQAIGVNKVGNLFPSAFKAAGIDTKAEHIAGTSGRKAAMEGGFQHNVPNNMLSGLAGHANANSLTSYVQGKEQSHKTLSLIMTRKMGQKDTGNFNEVLAEVEGHGGGDTVTETEELQSAPQQTHPVVSQPPTPTSSSQQTPQTLPLQQPPSSMQTPFSSQMQPPPHPLMCSAPLGFSMASYLHQQQLLAQHQQQLMAHHQQQLMAPQLGFPVNSLALMPAQQLFQPSLNMLTFSQPRASPIFSGSFGAHQTAPDARVEEIETKLEQQRKFFLAELERKDRAIAVQLQKLEEEACARAQEGSMRREEDG